MANSVPNQREITINKAPCDDKDFTHFYTKNNLGALEKAMQQLQSNGGFKLYIYLAKNRDKYSFYLSSRDFRECSGLGWKAYDTAFKELVDKGYLVQVKKDIYEFYDIPQLKDELIKIIIPKTKENKTNTFTF